MYTADQVKAAYAAMVTDTLFDGQDFAGDIDVVYDANDQLDVAATEAARAEERVHLEAGRAILASARLVYSKAVMSGNPIPDIDADGDTIVVSLGYTATTEYFRRVGLKHVDDLISVIECARRFNLTQQAVTQAIDTGKLRAFVQPKAPRRQGRRRISLRDAKKIWG